MILFFWRQLAKKHRNGAMRFEVFVVTSLVQMVTSSAVDVSEVPEADVLDVGVVVDAVTRSLKNVVLVSYGLSYKMSKCCENGS